MRQDAIHVIFAALALAFRTPKHKALSGRLSHSDASHSIRATAI